jgi:hypothetical protein
MALTLPPGVDALKKRNIIFTPTNSLSVATLSGATSVELTNYFSRNVFGISVTTERGTDEREGTGQVFETLGQDTWTVETLQYVWEPQAAPGAATNAAYEKLKRDTKGYLVIRLGIDSDTALAAAQKVWQVPVTFGEQAPMTPEGNAAEKLKIVQEVVVTGVVLTDQALIA